MSLISDVESYAAGSDPASAWSDARPRIGHLPIVLLLLLIVGTAIPATREIAVGVVVAGVVWAAVLACLLRRAPHLETVPAR